MVSLKFWGFGQLFIVIVAIMCVKEMLVESQFWLQSSFSWEAEMAVWIEFVTIIGIIRTWGLHFFTPWLVLGGRKCPTTRKWAALALLCFDASYSFVLCLRAGEIFIDPPPLPLLNFWDWVPNLTFLEPASWWNEKGAFVALLCVDPLGVERS